MFRRLRTPPPVVATPPRTGDGPRLGGVFIAVAVLLTGLLAGTERPAGTLVEPWIDTSNRDAVAVAWAIERSRETPEMAWSGSYGACRAGDASLALAGATIGRVNFYRGLAGVPATVRLSEEYSAKAQHAALTMSATGRLSHAPDDSFDCLDATGREAAANSNLYLGRIGPAAIDGYIEDPGERNRDVGHRNTILHPPTTEMGVGHVAGSRDSYPANALWVFDDGVFDEPPPVREADGFVAWPPRGYVPGEVVHPRWSFGLAGADFDRATVGMTVDGHDVALDVVTRHSLAGYVPAPIVVWEPDASASGEAAALATALTGDSWPAGRTADLDVEVRVDGVVIDGTERSYTYRISVMAPDRTGPGGVLIDTALQGAARAATLLATAVPILAG
ncbi:MAG: CAP domain-containing protein [Actinomycetota bacterium]